MEFLLVWKIDEIAVAKVAVVGPGNDIDKLHFVNVHVVEVLPEADALSPGLKPKLDEEVEVVERNLEVFVQEVI